VDFSDEGNQVRKEKKQLTASEHADRAIRYARQAEIWSIVAMIFMGIAMLARILKLIGVLP
jgi:hypothetical protein